MKKLSLIGVGKLGLCFALTLEKAAYDVLGCDISEEYVNSLNKKLFSSDEPGVNERMQEVVNFRATTNVEKTIQFSNIIFLLVATPSLPNGRYDHGQIESVMEQLISFGPQKEHKQLIVCCTTMPTYCDTVQERLEDYNYTVSYNPEFIAQGSILKDQLNPDMVLIGEGSKEAGDIIQEIYEKHTESTPKICRMNRVEAEICKIGLNCFLTTKIAFANMIGDIARFTKVRHEPILKAIGSDTRIGNKYLAYGYGYGGPCFPRDNRALALFAGDVEVDALISKASDESNKQHLEYQVELFQIENDMKHPVEFDFVTYKPESTILEESQQLLFAKELAMAGYKVIIKERQSVINEVKAKYGDIFEYRRRD